MRYDAVISPDGKYRYSLTRQWSDKPLVAWVMLNPSTADDNADDPTIRRCIAFSINWGFGGLKVYNLFAYRSTNKNVLLTVKDPVGPDNDEFIKSACTFGLKLILGWGNLPARLVPRSLSVLRMLRPFDPGYLVLTDRGFPVPSPLLER